MKRGTRILSFLSAAVLVLAASVAAFGETTFHYDALNRLWKVVYDDGSLLEYTYDEIGNRVTSLVDNPPNDPGYVSVTLNERSADLSWTGGDPNGDAVLYHVYLGTSQVPTTEVTSTDGQSSTSFHAQNLECGTTYYGFVKAVDEHGAIKKGSIWSLTTDGSSSPVMKMSYGPYFSSLQDAYDSDSTQGGSTFRTQLKIAGPLEFNKPISVTINGGYDCEFNSRSGVTTLTGSITIRNGTVTLGDFIISN